MIPARLRVGAERITPLSDSAKEKLPVRTGLSRRLRHERDSLPIISISDDGRFMADGKLAAPGDILDACSPMETHGSCK